jgi:hypothetical protein
MWARNVDTKVGAASPDDSLAAMEAAMKLAADRDEARKEQEREEEVSQPLLNDTSFDRRRTVAVYKGDGTRGHHMQVNYSIPPYKRWGSVAELT